MSGCIHNLHLTFMMFIFRNVEWMPSIFYYRKGWRVSSRRCAIRTVAITWIVSKIGVASLS